jgi:hypothetical protein
MDSWSYWLSHESDVNAVIVRLLQLALVASLMGLLRAWPRGARDAVGVFLVTAFAVTHRLTWAPVLRNENQHGWMFFSDVACGKPIHDTYGFGYFALHTPFMGWFGANLDTLLSLQVVLSALTPWVVMSLARGLGWSRAASALAGLMVAGNELIARNGRSEDLLVPAIALTLLAVDRALAWFGPQDDEGAPVTATPLDAVAAVGALVAATQTRPEMVLVAPALLAAAVLSTPHARAGLLDPARRRPHAIAALLGAVWIALPLHNLLYKLTHGERTAAHTIFDAHGSFLARLVNSGLPAGEVGNVLLVDAIVPVFVVVSAGLGLAALLWRRPAQGVALGLFWLLILRIWIPTQGTPEGAARLQHLPVLVACLLAGYGLAELGARLLPAAGDRPPIVVVALAVLLGGRAMPGGDSAMTSNGVVAQRIARAGLRELPEHSDLILPLGDRVVNSSFLECEETLVARDVRVVRMLPNDTFPTAAPGRPQIFWQGTPCWSFADEASAAGRTMRSECEAARRVCPRAFEGLDDTVPNRNLDIVAVPAEQVTLGFYACGP